MNVNVCDVCVVCFVVFACGKFVIIPTIGFCVNESDLLHGKDQLRLNITPSVNASEK
jgi:hypothetical protein